MTILDSSASLHRDKESTISNSLLERVREKDDAAWNRLMDMYGPLVHRWIRRMNVQESDAADIAQNVFQYVTTKIDDFRRDAPDQSFRVWLWTACRYRIIDFYRERKQFPEGRGGDNGYRLVTNVADLPKEPEPDDSPEGVREQAEIVKRAIKIVRGRTADNTWTAFWRTAIEGDEPNFVAEDLGVSVWTVYKARKRVVKRLRDELHGLIDVDQFLVRVHDADDATEEN